MSTLWNDDRKFRTEIQGFLDIGVPRLIGIAGDVEPPFVYSIGRVGLRGYDAELLGFCVSDSEDDKHALVDLINYLSSGVLVMPGQIAKDLAGNRYLIAEAEDFQDYYGANLREECTCQAGRWHGHDDYRLLVLVPGSPLMIH